MEERLSKTTCQPTRWNNKWNARRKQRYAEDEQYRKRVNKQNRDRYYRRMGEDPTYRLITLARGRLTNARKAIEHHEERLKFFNDRLVNDAKLLAGLIRKRDKR